MDSDKLFVGLGAVSVTVGGLLTFMFGKPDYWFFALVAFMILDYITGVSAAVIEGGLSSARGFKGILKKVMTLVPVAVGQIIDTAAGTGGTLRIAVIGFLVANEGISILENTARCGVKWPDKLIAVLEQLRDKHE